MAPLVPKNGPNEKASNPDVWACVTTKKAIPRTMPNRLMLIARRRANT